MSGTAAAGSEQWNIVSRTQSSLSVWWTHCLFRRSMDFFSSSILALTAFTMVAWKSSAPLTERNGQREQTNHSLMNAFWDSLVIELLGFAKRARHSELDSNSLAAVWNKDWRFKSTFGSVNTCLGKDIGSQYFVNRNETYVKKYSGLLHLGAFMVKPKHRSWQHF